jgi:hypothetical protein
VLLLLVAAMVLLLMMMHALLVGSCHVSLQQTQARNIIATSRTACSEAGVLWITQCYSNGFCHVSLQQTQARNIIATS